MKPLQYAHIHLPGPNASKQDLYMPASEVERARSYFQKLVERRYIRVKRHKRGMPGAGVAEHFRNTIYVPTIKNKSHFFTCLHEVGHIYHEPTCLENPPRMENPEEDSFAAEMAVIDEYNASIFALHHAQQFGLDTALFEKHAKRYVFTYVDKVHQRRLKWADVDWRVRDIATNWLGITEVHWSALKWILVD